MPPMKPWPMMRTFTFFIETLLSYRRLPRPPLFFAARFRGTAFARAFGAEGDDFLALLWGRFPATKAFSSSTACLHFLVAGQALGQKHRSIVHQSWGAPEWAASSFITGGKSMFPSPIGLWVLVWWSLSEP